MNLCTLGTLELSDTSFRRPVPLLLLSYLSIENRTHQRGRLADLFWPYAGDLRENRLSPQAYPLYLLIESTLERGSHATVPCTLLSRELDLPPKLSSVMTKLAPVHAELKRAGIVSDVQARNTGATVAVRYELSKQFLAEREGSGEDRAKRNLRLALHKLAQVGKYAPLEKGRRWVRSTLPTDVHALTSVLEADDIVQARSLYRGDFLNGVEGWLTEVGFELGGDLESWIAGTRREVAGRMQRGLLKAAERQAVRGAKKDAGELALEAYALYPSPELTNQELNLLCSLLDLGDHEAAERVRSQLASRGISLVLVTSEALNANLAWTPASKNQSAFPDTKGLYGSIARASVEHFTGREAELTALTRAVTDARVKHVHVRGRPGIGKSAVVNKLMLELDRTASPFDLIFYLPFQHPPHSLPESLLELLAESNAELRHSWNSRAETGVKLELLLASLRGQRTLLVLDNLEKLAGSEAQGELGLLIHMLVDRNDTPTLLTVGHHAVVLPEGLVGRAFQRQREVPLEGGLQFEDAATLLRKLDGDGQLGLADADAESLRAVCERAHGLPKVLQGIAGSLRTSPTLTLADVVTDSTVTERLHHDYVEDIYAQLSDPAREVINLCAVFAEPVPLGALTALLPHLNVRKVLDPLCGSYLVALVRSPETKVSLHEVDRAAIYRLLQNPNDGEVLRLHQAVATFHLKSASPRPWNTLEKLTGHLKGFQHLMSAGDFESACRVLLLVGIDHLHRLGYPALLLKLHKQLENRLNDDHLKSEHLNVMGVTNLALGQVEQAIKHFNDALVLSSVIGNERLSEDLMGNLGLSHYKLGLIELALMYYKDALKRIRKRGRFEEEHKYLGALALCYLEEKRLEYAARHFEKAIKVSHACGNEQALGLWYGSLARVECDRGELESAGENARQALTYTRKTGNRRSEACTLDNLGRVYVARDEVATGVALWLCSYRLHQEVGSPYLSELGERLREAAETSPCQRKLFEELTDHGHELVAEASGHYYEPLDAELVGSFEMSLRRSA